MTRRKAKKQQRQRRQKRQQAKTRKRESSRRSQRARASPSRDEVMEDMLPLFSTLGNASAPSGWAIEDLVTILTASEDIADEPEFEGLFINPMLCAETAIQVGREMGFDPGTLAALPAEEGEDAQMEILDKSMRRLLTEEWCQDVLGGLNDLRLRLKRSGRKNEVARVATMQSFLREDKSRASWPMTGLVQAIFYQSLTAGFEMIEASIEVMDAGAVEGTDTTLIERLKQSSLVQKADKALKKVPGLRKYLEKQADEAWEEGIEAIHAGDLYLGLYSPEELMDAIEVFSSLMGLGSVEEMMAADARSMEMSTKEIKIYLEQIECYITRLFTPTRLDQLRDRMDTILRDPAYTGEWLPFIVMLREYLQDENAIENEMVALISALFGEISAAVRVAGKGGIGDDGI